MLFARLETTEEIVHVLQDTPVIHTLEAAEKVRISLFVKKNATVVLYNEYRSLIVATSLT